MEINATSATNVYLSGVQSNYCKRYKQQLITDLVISRVRERSEIKLGFAANKSYCDTSYYRELVITVLT